jgi:peptidoglycan hydrolase-like protein with peptidoglycan-binding domain
MAAVANSLAKQYPFAAQQLKTAAAAIAKTTMTGVPVDNMTRNGPPGTGPSAQDDATIRAQIQSATDPVSLDNLANLLASKPGYGTLAQLARGRANELRAMLATATGVQKTQAVLTTAAPAVTAASFPLLVRGSTGDAVKTWQRIVKVNPDGNFGSGTEAATKRWQVAHGIYADGKVGPKTWAAAAATQAAALPPLAAPVLQTAPTSLPPPPSLSMPAMQAPTSTPLTDLQVKTLATAQYIKGARRGSEDKMMIKNWQTMAGVPGPDGLFGAGSAERMAEIGVSDLPMVWYWPKTNAGARVATYKSRLNEMAKQADAAGDSMRATALRASAARDNGQGRQIGE